MDYISQQDLLQHILDVSGMEVVSLISGGSSALVLHLRQGNKEFAAKLLVSRHNRWVDGHDLETFRMKVKHQSWLRESTEPIRAMYPEIVLQEHKEYWSWFIMRWWTGSSIFQEDGSQAVPIHLFQHRLQRTLDCLAAHGYAHLSAPGNAEYAINTYIHRVRRRFHYLTKSELRPLVSAGHLLVNGIKCPHPLTILDAIEQSSALMSLIAPPRLYFPLHGDLNLRNLLLSPQFDEALDDNLYQHIQLVDPRGDITPWDVLYDIGKMCFSVSVFEALLNSTFELISIKKDNLAQFSIEATSDWKRSVLGKLAAFNRAVSQATVLCAMIEDAEPMWQMRQPFVCACHMLSESACRISRVSDQIDEREPEHREVQRKAREHALILYTLGSLLLYQWYQNMQDALEHGAVLPVANMLQDVFLG